MKEMITAEMTEIRNLIIQTAAKRSSLKKEMEQWYTQHLTKRFPKMNELITVDASLSVLLLSLLGGCCQNLCEKINLDPEMFCELQSLSKFASCKDRTSTALGHVQSSLA